MERKLSEMEEELKVCILFCFGGLFERVRTHSKIFISFALFFSLFLLKGVAVCVMEFIYYCLSLSLSYSLECAINLSGSSDENTFLSFFWSHMGSFEFLL